MKTENSLRKRKSRERETNFYTQEQVTRTTAIFGEA